MTTVLRCMSSIRARIGVMPIPPAISSASGRRPASAVKTPKGPSPSTRVPGAISASRREKSPRPLEPGEGDRCIRGEVDRVPRLVRHPAPHDDDRQADDDDQQRGTDRCGDHSGVDPAAEHRRDLPRDRKPIHQRVAPDGEHDVREHEVQARVAVPAMPGAEPVESDEPLQPRQPREQQHLEERGVRAEEPGDPREARQPLAGAVDAEDVAAVPPQPHDRGKVADEDGAEEARGCNAGDVAAVDSDGARRGMLEGDFRHRRTVAASPVNPLRRR
jgi:hypothetical protein